ncbi:hypothetical protein QYF61_008949 [Mycteria americana]|uniref:Uncharacterized protein n=1 Tax=Mycteria americana TaxID=33587 RepID=A0AAN7PPH9_MYCAM|nr:hypothetical protein QYF61_008949 [Mycteria americana]
MVGVRISPVRGTGVRDSHGMARQGYRASLRAWLGRVHGRQGCGDLETSTAAVPLRQGLSPCHEVRGPKLNTVFEVRPHQCQVQGHNHFPSPAGHAIFHTSQDAIGLLGHLGTLLAHIQAAVDQRPQVLFCLAAFQPLFPKPVALHGVAVAQVQDLALGLVKPHTTGPSPLIQPVQDPLESLPTLKQINTPAQLGVICKLTEGVLDPFIQIIDKDIKQDWPQHRALGNTTCDQPPTGVNSIHHHSLGPAVQPVLYPVKSSPVQAMSSQFLQENAVGNSWKGWRLNHFPGQPLPMLDNPFSEVKFPNIQSKPPLAQLEAISSHPITSQLGEETDPHLATTSFQLHCPSLDTLQPLNVSLVVGGPKLNTIFEVRPHQCQVQGHDHFPSPAGHAIFDTSQDAIGLLGHLGTLLAHIQPSVNQHLQVLLCQAAFQPLFPKPVALHGVAVAQVQDPALSLVEPHTTDLGPSIQPVQINTPTQLGVICKLTEGALDPFVQIIDKDIKQDWPQHRALGNTACDRPPTRVNSIHHHSLGPAIQPVLYPEKSSPVQAMSSQFLQENAMPEKGKSFFLETCQKAPVQELPVIIPTKWKSSFLEWVSKRPQKW